MKRLGVRRRDSDRAVEAAYAEQRIFQEKVLEAGQRALDTLDAENEPGLVLVGRGLRIAVERHDNFEKLLAVGLTTVVGMQVFVIAAGVLRLIPLTGVPLPLLSYGGTSRVATAVVLASLIRTSSGPWYPARRERRRDETTEEQDTTDG